jgi:hypothetical protein
MGTTMLAFDILEQNGGFQNIKTKFRAINFEIAGISWKIILFFK